MVTFIFIICVAMAWVLMSKHRWGRFLYAIGGNEEASRFSGVPVVAAKILAYVVSGMFAAWQGYVRRHKNNKATRKPG